MDADNPPGDDVPIRLSEAARLAFPDGSIKTSSLRLEAARGRLVIWRIANKDMTSLAEIKRMIERCRVDRPIRPTPQERFEPFSIEDGKRAQATAMLKAKQLMERFRTEEANERARRGGTAKARQRNRGE